MKMSRCIFNVVLCLVLVNSVVIDTCLADACSDAQAAAAAAADAARDAGQAVILAMEQLAVANLLLAGTIASCGIISIACVLLIAGAAAYVAACSHTLYVAGQAYERAAARAIAAAEAATAACRSPEPGGNSEGRSRMNTQAVFEGNRVVNIKPNTSTAVFMLNSEDKSLFLQLLSPNGTRINPLSNNSFNYCGRVNTTTYYLILNPAPGAWTMEIKPFWAEEKGKDYSLLAYTFEKDTDAIFNDHYYDRGVDDDGNGLYDHIDVAVGVDVKVPGWYSISGSLWDYNNNEAIFAFNKTYLEQGNQSQTLKFYGMHNSGSYYLKNLTLETVVPPKRTNDQEFGADKLLDYLEGDRGLQDFRVEAYATKLYDKLDWPINMPWTTGIIGNYSDRGMDVNNDGLYETLAVDVGVNIAKQGEYTLTGFLYDLNKSEIAWAIDNNVFEPGRRKMKLNFDSRTIEKHGVSGPYRLGALSLWGKNWTIIDAKSYIYNTSAYNYSDFKG